MVAISAQYDVYESVFAGSQQREINMYSENLLGAYPGIINGTNWQVNCGGSTCYNYSILLNNLGIGAQIARIYINTTIGASPAGCAGVCIIDPASSSSLEPYKFRFLDRYVNAGESYHNVVFWLPVRLPAQCGSSTTGCNTIKVVTTRGRIFMFMYPFPILSAGAGIAEGGTGIYIGPLVITFQRALITYTNKILLTPPIPIGGSSGYWIVTPDGNNNVVLYVRIQTDAKAVNDVYLTPQSVFEMVRFDSPGAVNPFFIIAPIPLNYCFTYFNSTGIDCDAKYGYVSGNTYNGDPANIAPYKSCNAPPPQYTTNTCNNPPYNAGPRYMIPRPTQPGQRGKPVIVAFAVRSVNGDATKLQSLQWKNLSVTTFLGLSFVYDDGTGSYVYGVTLPFIALCINDPPSKPMCSV